MRQSKYCLSLVIVGEIYDSLSISYDLSPPCNQVSMTVESASCRILSIFWNIFTASSMGFRDVETTSLTLKKAAFLL